MHSLTKYLVSLEEHMEFILRKDMDNVSLWFDTQKNSNFEKSFDSTTSFLAAWMGPWIAG